MNRDTIVLRKVHGVLEACRLSTLGVFAGSTSMRAPTLTGIAGALVAFLLVPLALLGAIAMLLASIMAPDHAHLVATAAPHHLGLAAAALAGTTGTVDAAKIKEEILNVFEQFKAKNDEEIAQIKAKGVADPALSGEVTKLNDRLSELQKLVNRIQIGGGDERIELDPAMKAKLNAFFRPSEEERDRGGQSMLNLSFGRVADIRAAQGTTSAGVGGAIVAPTFSERLEKALLFFGGMIGVSETVTTETGADLPWPTVNDTAQQGAILAENGTITGQDITFSSATLKAYTYTSKLILVPWQLMQDAFFNVEELVADIAGERLGRILNSHFTVGTGSSQPNGAVTAASAGKVGVAGQTLSVIYDDLIDLIHSVDVAYRGNSKFMMNDASLKVVRKLKDSQGRPLWESSLQAGQPDTILGYPVIVNNDMPVMAANAKSILFGDFTKYKIRRVKDIQLVRLNERYADALQTGFFAYCRYDGNLINAGTNPVKYYQNSAT